MVTRKNWGKAQVFRRECFVPYSLNEIEDRNDLKFWDKGCLNVALNAINENKVLDIPVTLLENGWVVRV